MSHLSFAIKQFGLTEAAGPPPPAALPLPSPGRIVAVIGASGAGKTRALEALHGRMCRPLTRQQLARPLLSLFPARMPSAAVLRVLAQCGLSDATLWTRPARTLSAGELRRLELALVLAGTVPGRRPRDCTRIPFQDGEQLSEFVRKPSPERARKWRASIERRVQSLAANSAAGTVPFIADEFDAHLDAETALALAASLAQLAKRSNLRLVVSTHRPECLGALCAERVIEIDDGRARELPAPQPRDLLDEVSVERGSLSDYTRFARWHYLGARRPGPVTDVFVARREGRVIAVATLGPTHLFLGPRNLVLPQFSSHAVSNGGAKALNANVRLLQRVIVEPRWRALGVASHLLKAALPQLGVPYVECLAEMGEFSGFLDRAGFTPRGRCKPSREAARLIATLERLNLNVRDLMERRESVLARLSKRDRATVERQLKGLCRSRIETGAGSLRGLHTTPEHITQRALLRLHCQPQYFLWSQHE